MTLYNYLQKKYPESGCTKCPLAGDGYTQEDEYGTCPVDEINNDEDLESAKLPDNMDSCSE